jgi:predicted deacylase
MCLPQIVIANADQLTGEEIYQKVISLCDEQATQTGSVSLEVWFQVEAGNETALSNEFPRPELLQEIQKLFSGEVLAEVTARLQSWQEPACELQQAAWCVRIVT